MEPFSIRIEEQVLADLRARIGSTRWPDQAPGVAWEQGTDLAYLQQVLAYWADEFDWRAQERRLNAFDQFRAELDGVHIHFVHERASRGRGIPLILTHGWPSTFVELLPFMALDDPEPMIGVHLHNLEIPPYTGPGSRPLSEAERAYVAQQQRWSVTERGYSAIQSTKPQTLGYGLNDSPAGLAAWVLEKWRSWSDCHGDPDRRLTRDFLLTTVMLYWVTGTITPSIRDYFDNRWWSTVTVGPEDFVTVPTAIAVFANHFVPEGTPPREWGRTPLQRPSMDTDAQRRALRPRRGTRAPRPRHRHLLRRTVRMGEHDRQGSTDDQP